MIYLLDLRITGHTLGKECILAFFISRVITLFVWAKLEKRGEERRGGAMACSSMRTTKCMNVVTRELCHHLSLQSCICDVVLNFQLILYLLLLPL
jgi:hypothetical protein